MGIALEFVGSILVSQIMLILACAFAEQQMRGIYSLASVAPGYAAFLGIGICLAAWLLIVMTRQGMLHGLGQKSSRASSIRSNRNGS